MEFSEDGYCEALFIGGPIAGQTLTVPRNMATIEVPVRRSGSRPVSSVHLYTKKHAYRQKIFTFETHNYILYISEDLSARWAFDELLQAYKEKCEAQTTEFL